MRQYHLSGTVVIAALVLVVLIVSAPAAGVTGNITTNYIIVTEIPVMNGSAMNETALEPFHALPTPLTLVHVEVSETSLPGPRYMAFGPSAFDVSVSPVIIPFIVVFGLTGVFLWGMLLSRRSDAEERAGPGRMNE